MSTSVRNLSLEHFPPPPSSDSRSRVDCISDYLQALLQEIFQESGHIHLNLPCLGDLARFFGVPQLDVFDAFQNLRREGFDYRLEGFETPILFWKKSDGTQ